MKYLVTGGAGFIGCNLIRYLLEEESNQILNIDKLTYAGNLESLAGLEDHPNYSFRQVDIVDAERVNQVFEQFRPDGVFHLAAESHVDRSIDGQGAFVQTNVLGTFNLLQAARGLFDSMIAADRARFRFLHVSTDEVYGSLQPGEAGFSETTSYDPHSPYSATKAASDHLVRAWASTYGLPVLVTNCSNNYGPFQFPEKLIPVVILNAIRGKPIPVYGQGENVRDWLYVRDHVSALARVMADGRSGATYNIGANNEYRNIDLVRTLCRILDELVPVKNNPRYPGPAKAGIDSYADLITFVRDRPGHDLRYAIDASRISEELDWHPQEDPKSGFRKTVQWYLDNEAWWGRILSGEYQMNRIGLGSG